MASLSGETVRRWVSCPCSSVILFSIHLMGLLMDLACILAVSLMAICVNCRSRGNTPAASSTATVPDVLGIPRQRHFAFLCILASLAACLVFNPIMVLRLCCTL